MAIHTVLLFTSVGAMLAMTIITVEKMAISVTVLLDRVHQYSELANGY